MIQIFKTGIQYNKCQIIKGQTLKDMLEVPHQHQLFQRQLSFNMLPVQDKGCKAEKKLKDMIKQEDVEKIFRLGQPENGGLAGLPATDKRAAGNNNLQHEKQKKMEKEKAEAANKAAEYHLTGAMQSVAKHSGYDSIMRVNNVPAEEGEELFMRAAMLAQRTA